MKLRKKRVFGLLIVVVLVIVCLSVSRLNLKQEKKMTMLDLSDLSEADIKEYADQNELQLEVKYEYSFTVEKDKVIDQSIPKDKSIQKEDKLRVIISKGAVPKEEYEKNQIDELGKVPIMMYHGIENVPSSQTRYTGGNVDKDGYNRTSEAFQKDLEFYYQKGYRMMRLSDYVEGKIEVEFGKSPIILTFDDGKEDNFKVLSKKEGKLEIDPNCAVGILEEFKKKYPDFGVTATFFVNQELFQQPEYDEDILKWLVEHGYDIGNHTMTHPDFTKISQERSNEEVASLYQILDRIIPGKYVNIIALPFGSPYKLTHPNFSVILNSQEEGKTYSTKAALRVGWEA